MILRLLGLAGLVALAACGSGQNPALEGARSTTSTTGGGANGGPSNGGGALSLAVDVPDELVAGGQVTWRLTVTNRSDDDITLAFTSGRHGDVVLRAGGEEAYRWSEGMVFAQVLTDVAVPAGGEVTFELPGTLDVEPGPYVLEASVPADPAPEPVTRDVTVTG